MKKVLFIILFFCSVRLFGWTTPINLSNTTQFTNMPYVTVDKENRIHVVWFQRNNGTHIWRIMYTHCDGDSWSSPVDVSRNTTPYIEFYDPTVQVDTLGRVHVIWTHNEFEIMWTYCDGDTWSVPVNISNTPGGSSGPRTASDKFGRIHVVWFDGSSGDFEIWYNMYDGASWQGSQRISDTKWNGGPQVVTDSNGNPHVIWGHDSLWVTDWAQYSYYNGSSWTLPMDLMKIQGEIMLPCGMAMDSEEHIHVVSEKHQGDGIYYTYYDEISWSSPYLVYEPDSNSYVGCPDIAIDTTSGIGCVIRSGKYYRFFHDTTWDSPDSIEGAYSGVLPSITTGLGTFHLVWTGGGGAIYYSKHTLMGVEETDYKLQVTDCRLKAYPNPFVEGTKVLLSDSPIVGWDKKICVYDMVGRLVEERFFADAQNDKGGQNDRNTQVKDCKIGEKLQAGVYFVKAKGYKPTKIIKLR